jgi:hypothetical protein
VLHFQRLDIWQGTLTNDSFHADGIGIEGFTWWTWLASFAVDPPDGIPFEPFWRSLDGEEGGWVGGYALETLDLPFDERASDC